MTGMPPATAAVKLSTTADAPMPSKADRSNWSPSMGVSSIFQSPVCTMLPCSLLRMRPQQSGIECVTRIGWHLHISPLTEPECASMHGMVHLCQDASVP